jgi:hypothetical protein
LRWMTASGLKPSEVSDKAGIPRTTLYGYVRGDADTLKGTNEQRIAQAFNTTVEHIFSGRKPIATLGVFGKIGAKADVYAIDDHRDAPMYELPLPAALNPDGEYVAFEIDGFSMPPAEPGWVVVFRHTSLPVDELVNSVCLVDLSDGRRLFKRIRRGYEPGRYNLESWDGSPLIENQEITAALPFASLAPGRSAR